MLKKTVRAGGVVAMVVALMLLVGCASPFDGGEGLSEPIDVPPGASDGKAQPRETADGQSTDDAPRDEGADEEPEPALDPSGLEVGAVVTDEDIASAGGPDAFFWAEEISSDTFGRMEGLSYKADCQVPLSGLRYLRVLHVDPQGDSRVGELVVATSVVDEVVEIFRGLYDARFPIRKMRLVDDYGADDLASCSDGNTSAFNWRTIGGTNTISNHAWGLAIDINTFENPYCILSSGYVFPPEAARFADRSLQEPGMIHPGDVCYQLFIERGWTWGGDWQGTKDYQHFEKPSAL